MAWIESHTVLRNHRKVLPLSRALRLNIAQTIGHLHLLWYAALEQQENGDLSQWSDELIAELAGYSGEAPQFVRLLQEFGWFDKGTKKIHDWWDYAGRYLQGKYGRHPEKWQAIKSMYANSLQTTDKQQTLPTKPTIPTKPNQPYLTDERFEELWKDYPRKLGKERARDKARKQIVTDQLFQDALRAVKNYAISVKNTDEQYIKHGSTFFNKDWLDWINHVGDKKSEVKYGFN